MFAVRDDVVALYVDPRGPYPKLVREWYDEARDARTYAGPLPVVAHPPCGPWSKLRHLYRGSEHDCAPRALNQVQTFGGVLEHPAGSLFWDWAKLPLPGELPDIAGGFTIEVDQCAWGHVARKKTWLYFARVSRTAAVSSVRTGGTPTHWVSGFRSSNKPTPKHYKGRGVAVPPGIKVCSAQQRRRTPVTFAEWLLELAASARPNALFAGVGT